MCPQCEHFCAKFMQKVKISIFTLKCAKTDTFNMNTKPTQNQSWPNVMGCCPELFGRINLFIRIIWGDGHLSQSWAKHWGPASMASSYLLNPLSPPTSARIKTFHKKGAKKLSRKKEQKTFQNKGAKKNLPMASSCLLIPHRAE